MLACAPALIRNASGRDKICWQALTREMRTRKARWLDQRQSQLA
jgi:hypothetical protein